MCFDLEGTKFATTSFDGMVYVSAEGIDDDDALAHWLQQGLDHARSLPPKKPKKPKKADPVKRTR